jgi:hypothetical protein
VRKNPRKRVAEAYLPEETLIAVLNEKEQELYEAWKAAVANKSREDRQVGIYKVSNFIERRNNVSQEFVDLISRDIISSQVVEYLLRNPSVDKNMVANRYAKYMIEELKKSKGPHILYSGLDEIRRLAKYVPSNSFMLEAYIKWLTSYKYDAETQMNMIDRWINRVGVIEDERLILDLVIGWDLNTFLEFRMSHPSNGDKEVKEAYNDHFLHLLKSEDFDNMSNSLIISMTTYIKEFSVTVEDVQEAIEENESQKANRLYASIVALPGFDVPKAIKHIRKNVEARARAIYYLLYNMKEDTYKKYADILFENDDAIRVCEMQAANPMFKNPEVEKDIENKAFQYCKETHDTEAAITLEWVDAKEMLQFYEEEGAELPEEYMVKKAVQLLNEENYEKICNSLIEQNYNSGYETLKTISDRFPYAREYVESLIIKRIKRYSSLLRNLYDWSQVGGKITTAKCVQVLIDTVISTTTESLDIDQIISIITCLSRNKDALNKLMKKFIDEKKYEIAVKITSKIKSIDVSSLQDAVEEHKLWEEAINLMQDCRERIDVPRMKEFLQTCDDPIYIKHIAKMHDIPVVKYHNMSVLIHVLMPKTPIKLREIEKKFPAIYNKLKSTPLISSNKDTIITKEDLLKLDSKYEEQAKTYPIVEKSWNGVQRSYTQSTPQIVLCITLSEEDKKKLQDAEVWDTFEELSRANHFDVQDMIGWARVEPERANKEFVLIDEIQSDIQGDAAKLVRGGQDHDGKYAKVLEILKDFEDVALHTVSLFARANGYKHIYNHTFEGGKSLKPGSSPHPRPYSELPKSHYFYKVKENTPFNLPAEFYKREAKVVLNILRLARKLTS